MLIFAIDDERNLLLLLHMAIVEAAPKAEIVDFRQGMDALRAITERGLRPDFVFTDIRMPGLDGLRLALRIRGLSPQTRIVFVTGYAEYAVDAMRMHANGYIMKPVTAQRVHEELIYNAPERMAPSDRLWVQCFGYFDVFWQDKPLMFRRRQTKELLAYLIDREGAACTAEEIAASLWENETDMSAAKHRIRQLISDLRETLTAIGQEDILVRRRGQMAILRDRVDCDYYRMLDGDMNAVNSYYGEYMSQYTWAEMTEGRLYFRKK